MSHRTQLVAVYKQQQGKARVCGAFLRIIEQGCNLISCYWLVIRSDWESLGGGSKDTRARLAAGSLSLVSILTSSLGEMCLGVCGMDEGEEVASASFLPRREVDRTRPLPGNCTSLSWRVSGTASCGVVGSSSWCLGPLPPLRVTRLASEKRELEVQLSRSREEALAGRAARQEAEALRGLVRGLELELRQERGLGSRAASRRSQDCRRLAKEVRGQSRGGGASLGFGLVWTSAFSSSLPSAARGGEGL